MKQSSRQLTTGDYMRDYWTFWGSSMHNAWPPFSGWISTISWISVIVVILGFSGFVEVVREWVRTINHPIGNWYIANSWVFLLVIFVAWVFLWGTYKSYLNEKTETEKEKNRADNIKRQLDDIRSKDMELDRQVKQAEMAKNRYELKRKTSIYGDIIPPDIDQE